jgi:hypothetical protein
MIIQPTILNTGVQPANTHKVTFIDYDGTILKETYVASGGTVTAPTIPTIPNLTFQSWNNPLTNIQSDMVIGAVRKTTDDKTYVYITLTPTIGKMPTLKVNKTGSSIMTINWGDGTYTPTTQKGDISISHTYINYGDYVITIDSAQNYGLGYSSNNQRLLGGSSINAGLNKVLLSMYATATYDLALDGAETISLPMELSNFGIVQYNIKLKTVILPPNINSLMNNQFYGCRLLKYVSLPNSIIAVGTSSVNVCSLLSDINIKEKIALLEQINDSSFANGTYLNGDILINATTIGINAFYGQKKMESIVMNNTITIGASAFQYCLGLKSVTIPATVTSIGDSAFSSSYGIADFFIHATTPPLIASNTFSSSLLLKSKIHVPAASLSAYQSAINWSAFTNYLVGDL